MKKHLVVLLVLILVGVNMNTVTNASAVREFLGYSYTVQNDDVYLLLGVYDQSTNPSTLVEEYKFENLKYGDVLKFNFYCTYYFGMSEFKGTKQMTVPKGISSEFVAGCERSEFVELVSVTNRYGEVQEVQGSKIIRNDQPEPTEPEEPTDPIEPTDPTDPEEPTEPIEPEVPVCDFECIFECPGWQEYMNKLDKILAAIPPEPNWNQISDMFRDKIVQSLMNEVRSYFGSVGNIPSTPSDLPKLNNHNITDRVPEFEVPQGLDEAGFTADDVKQQAPVIQERPDESGGFDLSSNPIETLPEVPSVVMPGQTEEKNWMNMPNNPNNPFPNAPVESGNNVDLTNPPTPSGNNETVPMPGGNNSSAPIPGGSSEGSNNSLLDYKPTPTSPDGSGGEINN